MLAIHLIATVAKLLLPGGARSILSESVQVWGELGELYSQVGYGLILHKPHTRGSDGRLGNDFVEVKTIFSEKIKQHIAVKRAGNFSKLLIVRIDANFEFQSRWLGRKEIGKGAGKRARVKWLQDAESPARELPPRGLLTYHNKRSGKSVILGAVIL